MSHAEARLGERKSKLWATADEPDEPDRPGGWDTTGWTARDFEPRGDVPLLLDWEIACGMCGELTFFRQSESDAVRHAALLARKGVRCSRCQGWLSMSRVYGFRNPAVEIKPIPADTLEGPKYQGVRHGARPAS